MVKSRLAPPKCSMARKCLSCVAIHIKRSLYPNRAVNTLEIVKIGIY